MIIQGVKLNVTTLNHPLIPNSSKFYALFKDDYLKK